MAANVNRLELLQIADAVAREKSINRDVVLTIMADAIQKAARARYGFESNIKAHIHPKTGNITLERLLEVVEEVEHAPRQISLKEARFHHEDISIGETITEPLPPMDFGRIAAQSAKQVIVQKIREAERDQQYEEFKDKIGTIVSGVVKRIEYGNVFVDLGRGEAVVRRDELIPREVFRYGDRIRAYLYDVRREQRGPQIFLSRTHPQFMAKLFTMEVPEIYDGIVDIISVARDPGSRAKIAVVSRDASIDPVGACVGMRGSRVQAVVAELQGEKVDIVSWSPEAASFIVNALQPAEVGKVILDEDAKRIEVVVPDEQLSLAIGRRGQNVRLASQLTSWNIDILTESQDAENRQKEFAEHSKLFIEALNVDEMVAQILASEGFTSLEEIAYINIQEIKDIEGFDEETAQELQIRAKQYLSEIEKQQDEKRKALGVSDELYKLPHITAAMLVALGEDGVKTMEDFAGYAIDDLCGWRERKDGQNIFHKGLFAQFDISAAEVEAMIMQARLESNWIQEEDLIAQEMQTDQEIQTEQASQTDRESEMDQASEIAQAGEITQESEMTQEGEIAQESQMIQAQAAKQADQKQPSQDISTEQQQATESQQSANGQDGQDGSKAQAGQERQEPQAAQREQEQQQQQEAQEKQQDQAAPAPQAEQKEPAAQAEAAKSS